MGETIKIISTPHPDIELGTERQELESYLTFPEGGINDETGVIMVIPGLGEYTEADYYKNELRPYLADKLNCIAVGVNYFGIFRNSQIQVSPSFIYNINRIYSLNLSTENFTAAKSAVEVYRIMAEAIIKRGVTSLDIRCQPYLITGRGEYQSWGLLPAIDHLQVLGEVLDGYDVNLGRIMTYGKGYGGYIGHLMAKYAPYTFSAVIEREAYAKSEIKHIVSGELIEPDYLFSFDIDGSTVKFTIASTCNNPWTIEDENSAFYFSDSHRQIRSLLIDEHRKDSDTAFFISHSEDNPNSRVNEKDQVVDILNQHCIVNYHRISGDEKPSYESDREFIEYLLGENALIGQKASLDNDFSRNSDHIFHCGGKSYCFSYNNNGTLKVTVE